MQTFTLSEGTAARRRFFLHLVDATDGITPETGEAAGQPQVSKNGAAFGNTSATLTAVANGLYYVELTAAELDTLGKVIVRYKSANTAEFQDIGMVFTLDLFTSVTQTGDSYARVGAPVGASISADIAGVQSDTNDLQTRLPAALVSGRIDATVGAMQADVVTATAIQADAIGSSELAASAVTEIQSGLATAASLTTVEGKIDTIDDFVDTEIATLVTNVATILAAVDTEVAAIKAITDLLTLAGIADAVLSRPVSSVEGTAAFRSLAGAISKLVNKVEIDGATLRIKKTDDTTDYGTQTLTTDAAAVPVVAMDTN